MKNSFPGYTFDDGKNMYRGEDAGKGGYVYAEPGIYENVALLDVQSMHPTSIINMNMFGEYTKRYKDLYDLRICIKHHDYDTAKKLLNGLVAKYLDDEEQADAISQGAKLILNSTYGLTSATFDNAFRDQRNINNIVALRGALFMIDLKYAVQEKGFTVAHIKTDSIKVPNATPEIIKFVYDFGQEYGYTFEHEATYEKMCLVNNAVYIAKYNKEFMEKVPKYQKHNGWTATGTQFQVPYVFKTLFSKEEIKFEDLCETKTVSKGLIYLDFNEGLPEGEHDYRFVGKVGSFCPIKEGAGGGVLYREHEGSYSAVTGTKGYRWKEAEVVKANNLEDDIDRSYYNRLVDDAIAAINEYGDFERFSE